MSGYNIVELNTAPIELVGGGTIENIWSTPNLLSMAGKTVEMEFAVTYKNILYSGALTRLLINDGNKVIKWAIKSYTAADPRNNIASVTNLIFSFYVQDNDNVIVYCSQRATGIAESFTYQAVNAGETNNFYQLVRSNGTKLSFSIETSTDAASCIIHRYQFSIVDDSALFKLPAPITYTSPLALADTAVVPIEGLKNCRLEATCVFASTAPNTGTTPIWSVGTYQNPRTADNTILLQQIMRFNILHARRWELSINERSEVIPMPMGTITSMLGSFSRIYEVPAATVPSITHPNSIYFTLSSTSTHQMTLTDMFVRIIGN